MGGKKRARLVERGRDIITGAPYEICDVATGAGLDKDDDYRVRYCPSCGAEVVK